MAEKSGFDRGNETVDRQTGRKEQQRTEQVEGGVPYNGVNRDQNMQKSIPIHHPVGDTHSPGGSRK